MKYIISMILCSAFIGFAAQAQTTQQQVTFETVGCNFFGQLRVKFQESRRKVTVHKNRARCTTVKDALMADLQSKGAVFMANVSISERYDERCDRDDDGWRRCEVYRITYKIYEIPQLTVNGQIFWAKQFVSSRRVR